MNERIKELYSDAVEYAFSLTGTPRELREVISEKFAELTVGECINEIVYIGKANEVFGDRTDRGGLNHILWTTETAIEKIKLHFGVEE